MTDLFGARLDMSRPQVEAIDLGGGPRCSTERDGLLYFKDCGPRRLTVTFTMSGRAWDLRASLVLEGGPGALGRARAALVARHGAPTGTVNDGGGLVWLPGADGPGVERCSAAALLAGAEAETAAADPKRELPDDVPPGCLPIRIAILAQQGANAGVIVELQDVRPLLAELARSRAKP